MTNTCKAWLKIIVKGCGVHGHPVKMKAIKLETRISILSKKTKRIFIVSD